MACQTNTESLASLTFEVDFNGTWTDSRQDLVNAALDRWASVITHVPCGGDDTDPAGRILINANIEELDGSGGTAGTGGVSGGWPGCTIARRGEVKFDIDDIDNWDEALFTSVILHEVGHALGIGGLWGWQGCSTCEEDGNTVYTCPAAAAAYNDLAGLSQGTEANIVDPGCHHFSEDTFPREVMTPIVERDVYLSKLSAASAEDLGYIVDASQVDGYSLP